MTFAYSRLTNKLHSFMSKAWDIGTHNSASARIIFTKVVQSKIGRILRKSRAKIINSLVKRTSSLNIIFNKRRIKKT